MARVEVIIDGYKHNGTVKENTVIFVPLETKTGTGEGFFDDSACNSREFSLLSGKHIGVKEDFEQLSSICEHLLNNLYFTVSLAFEDIICMKNEVLQQMKPSCEKRILILHFIKRKDDVPQWMHDTLKMTPSSGKEEEYRHFVEELRVKFDQAVQNRPKKILVLMNPIGGKRKAKKIYDTVVLPLFQLAGISVELVVSERHEHLIQVMSSYNYKSVDGIAMMGGDGTLQQVMNVLVRRTQEDAGIDFNDPTVKLQPVPIPLSSIPTGSGNAVTTQLIGCLDVITSILHIIKGKSHDFDILSTHCDGKLIGYGACLFGIGALSDFVHMADRKLRWMKTSRYKAVINMYPFRRVHYLDAEITLHNRETEKLDNEDDIIKPGATKEEIITQKTSMLSASALDLLWPGRTRTKGKMFVSIYEEMGSYQMYRTWKKMMTLKDEHVKESREANLLIIRFKPRPNVPRVYNEMVCIDGELLTCTKPEYFVRVIQGVVRMM